MRYTKTMGIARKKTGVLLLCAFSFSTRAMHPQLQDFCDRVLSRGRGLELPRDRKLIAHKSYKVLLDDGRVINGSFLGAKSKRLHDLLDYYYFRDFESGEEVPVLRSSVLHIQPVPNLRKLLRDQDKYQSTYGVDPAPALQKLARASRTLVQEGMYEFAVEKKVWESLNLEKRGALVNTARLNLESLKAFDAEMQDLLGLKSGRAPVYVQYFSDEDPFTNSFLLRPHKIHGLEHEVITLYVDPANGFFGHDIGTILHERGHSHTFFPKRNSIVPEHLSRDFAFAEGIADVLYAVHNLDPAIGRNDQARAAGFRNIERRQRTDVGEDGKAAKPTTIRAPFDALHIGRMEAHHLSHFYAFPMWRLFTNLKEKHLSTAENWPKFLSFLRENETAYLNRQSERWSIANRSFKVNEETLYMLNLHFYFAGLKAFADQEAGTPLGEVLAKTYQNSREAFDLSWSRIEEQAASFKTPTKE
jgi:hypothetical protein